MCSSRSHVICARMQIQYKVVAYLHHSLHTVRESAISGAVILTFANFAFIIALNDRGDALHSLSLHCITP